MVYERGLGPRHVDRIDLAARREDGLLARRNKRDPLADDLRPHGIGADHDLASPLRPPGPATKPIDAECRAEGSHVLPLVDPAEGNQHLMREDGPFHCNALGLAERGGIDRPPDEKGVLACRCLGRSGAKRADPLSHLSEAR